MDEKSKLNLVINSIKEYSHDVLYHNVLISCSNSTYVGLIRIGFRLFRVIRTCDEIYEVKLNH